MTVQECRLQVGDILLDASARMVRTRTGEQYHLTPIECALLRFLMQRAGRVVSRAEIMAQVWDTTYLGDTRTLDTYVHMLRQKIEDVPRSPSCLRTIRGTGYRFVRRID